MTTHNAPTPAVDDDFAWDVDSLATTYEVVDAPAPSQRVLRQRAAARFALERTAHRDALAAEGLITNTEWMRRHVKVTQVG